MRTLTPAYGRDYKSIAAVKTDWESGKDFILNDIQDRYDGKPLNISDARREGWKFVLIRYKGLREIRQFKVPKESTLTPATASKPAPKPKRTRKVERCNMCGIRIPSGWCRSCFGPRF